MNAGIPEEYKSLTLNFNFNDLESAEQLFNQYPGQIAAFILEPATTEEPKEGFLNQLKDLCYRNGALLVLDEMITGFRWHLQGASAYYGVEPDLVTFGKGMANGFSVAALGGKREIMELGGLYSDKERVFLISTTHGAEMCGLVAFVETLKVSKELHEISQILRYGRILLDGANDIARDMGIEEYFEFVGMPCSPNFVTKNKNGENSLEFRTLFIQEMIKQGVLMPWVAISYSHRDEEINITMEAIRHSLQVYRKALDDGVYKYLEGRPIKPVFRKWN